MGCGFPQGIITIRVNIIYFQNATLLGPKIAAQFIEIVILKAEYW